MLFASRCVVFGDFRFNVPTRELLRIGSQGAATPVSLGSRAADLLHLFIDRPGELITKSEIMDAVWPNTAVEESNLTVQISALRRALGCGRNGVMYIQTVPGRGYRFTPWVKAFTAQAEQQNGAAPADVLGALRADAAKGSRPRLNASPESVALPLALSPPALSLEVHADDVTMAVPHARQTNVWWLFWLHGVAGIILGLVLVTAPGVTAVALASFLGFYWLLMGMLALVRVFVDHSVPWILSLVIGVVGILAGIVVVRYMLLAILVLPTAIIVALGLQGLVMGGLEIVGVLLGAGVGSAILGVIYVLTGLFLLSSPVVTVLAAPLAFGVLFLLQGVALTVFALHSRN